MEDTIRKSILLLMGLLMGLYCFCQPCAQDSIGTNFWYQDSLLSDTITCYPYDCPVEKCQTWHLPGGFVGTVQVGAEPFGTYHIMVMNTCDTVRLDTCLILSEGLAFRWIYTANFQSSAQVSLCGFNGAIGVIHCQSDTTTNPLPHPIILLDTLCMATSVQSPLPSLMECESPQLYDILHRPVNVPRNKLPAGIYWEFCGQSYTGKKVLVIR